MGASTFFGDLNYGDTKSKETKFRGYTQLETALLITRNLPPLIGGMERLIWHIAHAMHRRYRLIVVGPPGCSIHLPDHVIVQEVPISSLLRFMTSSTFHAFRLVRTFKPQLVFCGSGLLAPVSYTAARSKKVKKIVYLHGLDIEVDNFIYQSLWPPFFRKMDKILVNSHFTRDLALSKGVDGTKITVVHPGVALPNFSHKANASKTFRDRYGLGPNPLMLYVGRITKRKGLGVFVERILPEIIKKCNEAKLVVIGDEPKGGLLENKGEIERVKNLIRENGFEERVLFLGARPHDHPELSEAYFAADVLVFPVQELPGDNEGFGMVAVEAAAHGTPTVAFKAGGVTDAVKDGVSGFLVPAGDTLQFSEQVVNILNARCKLPAALVRSFADSFGWHSFTANFLQTLS